MTSKTEQVSQNVIKWYETGLSENIQRQKNKITDKKSCISVMMS